MGIDEVKDGFGNDSLCDMDSSGNWGYGDYQSNIGGCIGYPCVSCHLILMAYYPKQMGALCNAYDIVRSETSNWISRIFLFLSYILVDIHTLHNR